MALSTESRRYKQQTVNAVRGITAVGSVRNRGRQSL